MNWNSTGCIQMRSGAHEQLLASLRASGVSATWFMVGGLTLRESDGPRDRRMAGLPAYWTACIPAGRRNDDAAVVSPFVCEAAAQSAPISGSGTAWRSDSFNLDRSARDAGSDEVGACRGCQGAETSSCAAAIVLFRTGPGGVPRGASGARHPLLPRPHSGVGLRLGRTLPGSDAAVFR